MIKRKLGGSVRGDRQARHHVAAANPNRDIPTTNLRPMVAVITQVATLVLYATMIREGFPH